MRALLPVLLLAACSNEPAAPAAVESSCRQQLFEGSRFTVCDPEDGRLVLFAAGRGESALRTFSELAATLDTDEVAFAMNAGMFDEDGRPIGLASSNGKQAKPVNLNDGPGNFHMKPNGVFVVNAAGGAAIYPSDAIPQFRAPTRLQTQSGPLLVYRNKLHPRIEHDGQSRLIRNGVGVRDAKALFVISEDPVSFGRFARFFRDGLQTPDALFFDGSVSSLWDPANGRQDSHTPLGPIIVALKPAQVKRAESAPGRGDPATP
jgi:uncharacterized protein YigE (DUF2233 family)